MNFENKPEWIGSLLTRQLFTIAGTHVTFMSILVFLFILLISFIISGLVQRAFKKLFAHRFAKKEGTFAAILRLVHYVILIIGLAVALQVVGINISALFAAGAVFAIAVGFAMQNILQNFVSGIIILLERSIKPGDILELNDTVVKVIEVGIRTTIVRTWREEELILPNSIFTQTAVKNYTLRDNEFRLGVTVGVTYNSDMKKVIEVLEKTLQDIPWKLSKPEPRVMLQDFGSSSVDFGAYVSIDEPWKQRIYMSELRKAIWFAFKDADITIAFPQLDVHFDPPVTEAFSGLKQVV